MNPPSARGINRQGVDATFEADETRKSQLLLEAQLRRAQHQSGVAAEKCAEAAVIEEQLRDRCFTQGLKDKAFVHGFSAASCWAQAGDFHHAIVLCQELLAHADLPERLRHRVDAYAETLHARRAQWYEELILQDVGHEVKAVLNVPESVSLAALIPVAYFTGDDFKSAKRVPARERTYWNGWGQTR